MGCGAEATLAVLACDELVSCCSRFSRPGLAEAALAKAAESERLNRPAAA